eukprot:7329882-Prymnesium_polylepis.2
MLCCAGAPVVHARGVCWLGRALRLCCVHAGGGIGAAAGRPAGATPQGPFDPHARAHWAAHSVRRGARRGLRPSPPWPVSSPRLVIFKTKNSTKQTAVSQRSVDAC